METFLATLTFGFGVALAVFVGTRLHSGLSRQERENLTSTQMDT